MSNTAYIVTEKANNLIVSSEFQGVQLKIIGLAFSDDDTGIGPSIEELPGNKQNAQALKFEDVLNGGVAIIGYIIPDSDFNAKSVGVYIKDNNGEPLLWRVGQINIDFNSGVNSVVKVYTNLNDNEVSLIDLEGLVVDRYYGWMAKLTLSDLRKSRLLMQEIIRSVNSE